MTWLSVQIILQSFQIQTTLKIKQILLKLTKEYILQFLVIQEWEKLIQEYFFMFKNDS